MGLKPGADRPVTRGKLVQFRDGFADHLGRPDIHRQIVSLIQNFLCDPNHLSADSEVMNADRIGFGRERVRTLAADAR